MIDRYVTVDNRLVTTDDRIDDGNGRYLVVGHQSSVVIHHKTRRACTFNFLLIYRYGKAF